MRKKSAINIKEEEKSLLNNVNFFKNLNNENLKRN